VEIKVVLAEGAKAPERAHESDAGFDLYALKKSFADKHGYMEFDTGVSVEIPEGHVGYVFPRSSISNYNLALTNSVGVVDSGYRGSIKFRFKRSTIGNSYYDVGDKIGQLIIMPIPQVSYKVVDSLEDSDRSDKGFGSTDKGEANA
jgi:dUTP pyrophosphatase